MRHLSRSFTGLWLGFSLGIILLKGTSPCYLAVGVAVTVQIFLVRQQLVHFNP